MCDGCKRIDQLGKRSQVSREEQEQCDIMLRWHGGFKR